METQWMQKPIDELLNRNPAFSRVLDSLGIDYCCGGSRTLETACRDSGLEPHRVLELIAAFESVQADSGALAAMGLVELAEHIESIHHGYLREELPRLRAMTDKVARVHGRHDPRLEEVRDVFRGFADELEAHMEKEEKVLFPAMRSLEAEGALADFHCGSLSAPISVMEADHADAVAALSRLRGLTGGYAPPDWACNTYRAMLERLKALDEDMESHMRKEEILLFPRALRLEKQGRGT
jgi:regulator of cell morphogenesis and NO signaling